MDRSSAPITPSVATSSSSPGRGRNRTASSNARLLNINRADWKSRVGAPVRHLAVRRALTTGQRQAYFDDFTVWIDPAISPIAVALSERIENEVDDVRRRTIFRELVIEDFGADAKSAIPDNN